MFEIKGIRTFAMSAKNLDKSVEFYTKIVGGKVVKTVEPTEEQLKAGQVKEVDVARQLRGAYLRRVKRAARRRSAPHPQHPVAGKRPGAQNAPRRPAPWWKKSARTAAPTTTRSMSSTPTAIAGSCRLPKKISSTRSSGSKRSRSSIRLTRPESQRLEPLEQLERLERAQSSIVFF